MQGCEALTVPKDNAGRSFKIGPCEDEPITNAIRTVAKQIRKKIHEVSIDR